MNKNRQAQFGFALGSLPSLLLFLRVVTSSTWWPGCFLWLVGWLGGPDPEASRLA
ncbi:hypothetical protein [Fibrella aestuarina]|uniref:hypothetical protein n=1 Tax=Fibrella aestuarina TaxID=651143 RepID=UPI0003135CBA|nr:hypothetical protein [Fibrella aestuarina]